MNNPAFIKDYSTCLFFNEDRFEKLYLFCTIASYIIVNEVPINQSKGSKNFRLSLILKTTSNEQDTNIICYLIFKSLDVNIL